MVRRRRFRKKSRRAILEEIIKLKDEKALKEESFDISDSEAKLSYLRLAVAQERYKISEKAKVRDYVV
ncbi:MAG: hypothetical protein K6T73_06640 [Candidatus Bathyarchaeota archaeon]|nr:hypothetical protein [Candidatus Bathyarchaeota archaeon]